MLASAGALVVLAAVELASDVPWWIWVAWAVLAVVAGTQAVRSRA